MKKLLCIVLALVLVLSCTCVAESAITKIIYGKIKSANGVSTDLHILPGDYRPVTHTAANGTSVTVLFEGTAWHKVMITAGGQIGWVRANEISITTRGNSALTYGASLTGAKTVRSGDGYAALRWGPGTEYDVMDNIANGTYVYSYERSGDWVRVLLEDTRVGYIHYSLLENAKMKTNWGEVTFYGMVQVTGAEAIWRKKPDYSSSSTGTFKNGKILELVGQQGGFYYFYDFDTNKYGYISTDVVSPEGLTKTAVSAPLYYDNPYVYATDELWNIDAGKTLKILASDGYVSRVQYENVIGYIIDDKLIY